MATEPKAMNDDEILAAVRSELADCIGGDDGGTIPERRRKGLSYYLGRPLGNEVEGRSKVIITHVADTIEWMMPSIMRTFMGARNIARFMPVGPEDVEQAEQATAHCRHTFTRHNNGYLIFYQWFKDALIGMNGYVKYGWEKVKERHVQRFTGLSELELSYILKEYDGEVVAQEERKQVVQVANPVTGAPEEVEQSVFDAKIAWTKTYSCFKVYNVPPEEMMISKRATLDMDEVRFAAWQTKRTRGQLVAMGYPKSKIELLAIDSEMETAPERIERFEDEDGGTYRGGSSGTADWASQEVWLTECWGRLDQDGDGIQELRRIVVAGGRKAFSILENEEVREIPIATCTPIPMPHKHHGRSEAELTQDLQAIASTVARNILDNLTHVNNVRYAAVVGECEIDDLVSNRPGGVVRVNSPGAVMPLPTGSLGPMAFNMLEYVHSLKENRTGITRYNQGTDAESLNQTATGIRSIMGASQARLDSVNKNLAETGVKRLMRAYLKAAVENAPDVQGELVQIGGKWVQIDPSKWNPDMDVEIEVGLGSGDAEQRLAQIQQIGVLQREIGGSPYGALLLEPRNVYETASAFLEELGYKAVGRFFSDPEGKEMPPPPPDPAMVKAQAEIEKMKAEIELEKARLALDMERAKQEMALEEMKARSQIALQIQKAEAEQRIARMKAVNAAMIEQGRSEHQRALEEERFEHERELDNRREEEGYGEQEGR